MIENKPSNKEGDDKWLGIKLEIEFNNRMLAEECGISLEELELLLDNPDEWRAFYINRMGNNP